MSEELERTGPAPLVPIEQAAWVERERAVVAAERRRVVTRGLLAHWTAAEMAEELERLPLEKRPADCSAAAVEREIAALREEWARERGVTLERLVDEDLARFAEIERAL